MFEREKQLLEQVLHLQKRKFWEGENERAARDLKTAINDKFTSTHDSV